MASDSLAEINFDFDFSPGGEPSFAYLARVFRELPLLLERSDGKLSAKQILTLLP